MSESPPATLLIPKARWVEIAVGTQGFSRNANNFDLLRLIAATLVIIAHTYPLTGRPYTQEPLMRLTGGLNFGELGVYIFFAMSGFLVAKSWDVDPSVLNFFVKRSLRIFPGLMAVTLFLIFVLGPIITTLSLRDYFTSGITWDYLGCVLIYRMPFELPGVFESNSYAKVVNGSLWTLPYEITCYLALIFWGITGIIKRPTLLLVAHALSLTMILIFAESLRPYAIPYLGVSLYHLANLYTYFSAGLLVYKFRDRLSFGHRYAVAALLVWVLSFNTQFIKATSYLCVPYLTFYIAFLPVRAFHHFGKRGDFSYGVYIYAFPVQQIIVSFWGIEISPLTMITLAIIFTAPLALLSWFFVEKPGLSLKSVVLRGNALAASSQP